LTAVELDDLVARVDGEQRAGRQDAEAEMLIASARATAETR